MELIFYHKNVAYMVDGDGDDGGLYTVCIIIIL